MAFLTLKLPLCVFWLAKDLTARGLVLPSLERHLNLNNSTRDLDLKLLSDLVVRTKNSLMSLSMYRPEQKWIKLFATESTISASNLQDWLLTQSLLFSIFNNLRCKQVGEKGMNSGPVLSRSSSDKPVVLKWFWPSVYKQK